MAPSTAEATRLPSPVRLPSRATAAAALHAGDWPRTTRVLPWALAGFLVMLWLVPFDSTTLPVTLPVDSRLDRFAVVLLGLTWILAALGIREAGPRAFRSPIGVVILVFLALATISVLANMTVLDRIGELNLAVKKLSLLASFAVFFFVVATTVRGRELRPFMSFTIALAVIAAAGTIVEYRTGTNYFFNLARDLIPGASISAAPTDPEFGRQVSTGPTAHGLAIATILAIALPMAWVRLAESRDLGRRALYLVASVILIAGAVATLRKTAFIAPAVALAVVTVYRPRQMLRLVPVGLAVVVLVQLMVPGALSSIRYEFKGESRSTEGRTDDYAAVAPDIVAHPLLGRGYGTYDPKAYVHEGSLEVHRVLDNQYLGLLVEVGLLGSLAFLAIPAIGIISLHRMARSADPARAGPAVAIIGAIAAFVVSLALFDSLAFAHVPYLFFFVLGLAVTARRVGLDAPPDAVAPPDAEAATQADPWPAVDPAHAIPAVAVHPAPPVRATTTPKPKRRSRRAAKWSEEKSPERVFVVGTGRCGTESLAGLLSAAPGCELEHEREPALFGEALDYLEGRMPAGKMAELIRETRLQDTPPGTRVVGESNQRLALVLPALDQAFPDARYIWLLRDGRDTVDSLYSRLWYHRREASLRPALREWATSRPDASRLGLMSDDEWQGMDRFARCCWYWAFVNGLIARQGNTVGDRMLMIRIEELGDRLPEIADHVGIGRDELATAPRLNESRDARRVGWRNWSQHQRATFERHAGAAMDHLYPDWRTPEWEHGPRFGAAWRRHASTARRRLVGAELRARKVHPAGWRKSGTADDSSGALDP